MSKVSPWLSWLAAVLAWLCALALLANIALHGAKYQWDFKVYYAAAWTFAEGHDPYAPVPQDYTPGGYLPFLYPPLTLGLFRLFALPPLLPAAALWLALKVGALVGLFCVWSRRFLPLSARSAATVVFCLLAFNKALYTDIASGNVTVFEELALWLGFAALLAGRPFAFCLCLILAAQFKVTPIAFLVLLLLVPPRPQWRAFFAGLLGFAALFSLNVLLYPALTHEFFAVASGIDHRGSNNPSTLAFFRDLSDTLHLPPAAAPALYLLVVVIVLSASAAAYAACRRRAVPDSRLVIFFACLVYGLCVPRFTNYTYILLLAPALHALRTEPRRRLAWVVGAVVVLAAGLEAVAALTRALPLLVPYLPLWGAFLIWGLLLRRLRTPDGGKMGV